MSIWEEQENANINEEVKVGFTIIIPTVITVPLQPSG